ncbi:putative threonine--tRNA ligase 1 [uncultured archaeon]|nr:putative threonine--tRNA ligase 1 [uncultured archaeon]
MPKVKLPDGKILDVPAGATAADAIGMIGKRLLSATVAAEVNGKQVDLTYKLPEECSLKAFTFDSPQGKEVFRHSSAHILAQAVFRLFPNALPTIGPAVEEGFYYDFADCQPFTPEDLAKIEAEMAKIVDENLPIARKEVNKKEALKLFSNNRFKQEMINELPEGELTVYMNGAEWCDLCRGPHVPTTGAIKAFKLTKTSSAYWRADASKDSLQRLYGVSFPEKKQLDEYLAMLEAAEKCDHRKLGTQLGLFMFHEWSPGSPFVMPKGTIIYNELLSYLRAEYIKRGYKEVVTPQLFNKALWEQSGHWQFYKDNMFILNVDEQEFSLKPMNCPSHMLIYNSTAHSYRDLPLRIADFCMLHRNELKGVLGGMTRVRKFSQDDSHIFCTPEQIGQEIDAMLDFVKFVYVDTFHFKFTAKLSTRPEKFMGEISQWDSAERHLEDALKKNNIPYIVNAGDGAFYGPKIDFDVKDALGRGWQLDPIQVDFQMPQRFGCHYEGADGKEHTCVVLHRAIIGSLERFLGVLTENYAGKFPLWLSPVQVALLSVSDPYNEFTEQVAAQMRAAGIRAESNCRQETIGAKIRNAQLEKIPYMLVIGQKEKDSGSFAVRTLDGKVEEGVPLADFISKVKGGIENRL